MIYQAFAGSPFASSDPATSGFIRGVVVRGRQLGRELGYPTANVLLGEEVKFEFGVYATRSRLGDGRFLPGVASIGCNPTTGRVSPRLEVFLFDFDADIYGAVLETELVEFIRPELTFADIATLVDQIRLDVEMARSILVPEPWSGQVARMVVDAVEAQPASARHQPTGRSG